MVIKWIFLLWALIVCPFARADQAPSPARRAEIEAMMPQWPDYKKRAEFLTSGLGSNPRFNADQAPKFAELGRVIMASAEKYEEKEKQRHVKLLMVLQLQALSHQGVSKDSEYTSAKVAARVAALDKFYQLRMLHLYGYIVPHLLDEDIKDGSGRPVGRDTVDGWEMLDIASETGPMLADYSAATGLAKELAPFTTLD